MESKKYEMVFCIVNSGFSGEVMDAARSVGATGGTIIHARGTASQKAEEEFKITINPDKDLVMIAVKADVKDDVLKAIYEQAGLNSDAQGIAFSMPISDYVGLK